jgi:hypothetical protein
MKILLNNKLIYEYTLSLKQNFNDNKINLPIKLNYAIQRNLNTLSQIVETTEKMKMAIGEKYGEYNSETNSYQIPPEQVPNANKELNTLMEIEESVDIRKIKLSELENLSLTSEQMASLLFMIEEEE